MPETKHLGKQDRCDAGSKMAEKVMCKLNLLDGMDLVSRESTNDDFYEGIDFLNRRNGSTFQCKVRESGGDIIHEAVKYIPNGKTGPDFGFQIKAGRDARSVAKFTVCQPKGTQNLHVVLTEKFKSVANGLIRAFAHSNGYSIYEIEERNGVMCPVVDLTTDQIRAYWKRAMPTARKSVPIYGADIDGNVAQVHFKIEEGDKKVYGKLLCYVPCEAVPGATIIKYL
jgi:hypothetical protein